MSLRGLSMSFDRACIPYTFESVRWNSLAHSTPDLTFSSLPNFATGFSLADTEMSQSSDHIPLLYSLAMHRPQVHSISLTNSTKAAALFAKLSDNLPVHTLADQMHNCVHLATFSITKRTFTGPPRWWTPACSKAAGVRKNARRSINKSVSITSLHFYDLACKQFKAVCKAAKQTFIRNIFSQSTQGSSHFYKIVSNMTTNFINHSNAPYFRDLEQVLTESSVLAERWEDAPLKLPSSASAPDRHFSVVDIRWAMDKLKNAAPGPDHLTKETLIKFFDSNPRTFTKLVDDSLALPYLHTLWRHAIVILVPKKDGSKRPISITSAFAKLLEILWQREAITFTNSHNLLQPFQIGFREGEGIFGPLSAVDMFLRKAKQDKNQSVLVTLDLASAYCRVSRHLLLSKMTRSNTPPLLQNFTHCLLEGRSFKCRLGKCVGPTLPSNKGIPQGCISSPLLFNWFMSDFPAPQKPVELLIYADDILIMSAGPNIKSALDSCQSFLDKIFNWCALNEMIVNISKCHVLVPFFNETSLVPLKIGSDGIQFSPSLTYLGVVFSSQLRATQHIERNIALAFKAVACFRKLWGRNSGAFSNQKVFVYTQFIRPRLEFACCLLRRTHRHNTRLDTTERKILKTILGLPFSTSNTALYLQTGIPPLSSRLSLLCRRLCFRILGSRLCRLYHPIFLHSSPLTSLNPHNWSALNAPEICNAFTDVHRFIELNLNYWELFTRPAIVLDNLFPGKKEIRNKSHINWAQVIETRLHSLHSGRQLLIATDGSVVGSSAACGVVTSTMSTSLRLLDYASAFESECIAIDIALNYLLSQTLHDYDAVFLITDCSSALTFLQSSRMDASLSYFWKKILLVRSKIHFYLIWVPSHVGFVPNERADQAAKAGLHLP